MVKPLLPKQLLGVRFPSLAPVIDQPLRLENNLIISKAGMRRNPCQHFSEQFARLGWMNGFVLKFVLKGVNI